MTIFQTKKKKIVVCNIMLNLWLKKNEKKQKDQLLSNFWKVERWEKMFQTYINENIPKLITQIIIENLKKYTFKIHQNWKQEPEVKLKL